MPVAASCGPKPPPPRQVHRGPTPRAEKADRRQLPVVQQAIVKNALALLRQLDPACTAAHDPEPAAIESCNQHQDAGIVTSFPGLGPPTDARVIAEIGDDPSRFRDPKGVRTYVGTTSITRASGKTKTVTCRHVKNNRLYATDYTWTFTALTASPGALAHYDCRRDTGDRHAAAPRHLYGRLLGCIRRCLITGPHYD
jgi:hypothetical protein